MLIGFAKNMVILRKIIICFLWLAVSLTTWANPKATQRNDEYFLWPISHASSNYYHQYKPLSLFNLETFTASSRVVNPGSQFSSQLISQPGSTITSTVKGGNWSDPASWSRGVIPGEGDDVVIADGATVTIDTDPPALNSLIIGQGTSGILQFDENAARTLSAAMITVKYGGTFRSAQSGSIKDHQLIAQGSIVNNGVIDFSSNLNETGVEIVFTGSSNAIFNCSDARLTNLRQTNGITLNKGSSAASVLSFIPGNVFKVLSDGGSTSKGFLKIVSGTFNIIGSNSFSSPVFNTDGDYTIPSAGGFWLGNQNATVTAKDGSVFIYGDLKITNGIFNAGISGGNVLETTNGGHFNISGGTLNVSGKFNVDKGSCSISGGKINLAMLENTQNSEPTFNISAQANLEIFGNSFISFAYPNSLATPANDIQVQDGSGLKRINGGIIQLGTEVTPAGSTFLVAGTRVINILKVLNVCDTKVFNTSKADISSVPISSLPQVVFDKEAPRCNAPPKITLKCGEALPPKYASLEDFIQAGGEATDNCTLLPASFKFVGQVQSNAYCPYTITRTYSLSDASGNISLIRQPIVVERDATPPKPQPEAIAENTDTQELKLKSAQASFTAVKNGNWNDPTTWGTVGVPTSADDVNTAGFTVTVDAAAVCNNITIDAGGTLNYSGGNTLQVHGNWTNNGTYSGGTNGVVEFTGSSNASISGTTNFEELKITKGILTTTLTISGTTTVTNGGSLLMNSGLITIPAGGSFTVNPSSALNIPITAGFDLTGGALNTGNFTITNEGLIRITSGTANFGTNSGNSVHNQVDGAFIVSGGTVNIAGRLENSASGTLVPPGVTSGISISGGTVTLATVGNGLTNVGSLNVTPAGTFSFTNGTIVFQNESTATTAIDLGLVGGSGAKTTVGGTLQFGNGSTPAGTVFNISSEILLNRVTSSANADLKLINDITIGQWVLDSNTSVDLNGNEIQLATSSTGTFNFPLDNGSGVSIPVSIQLTSGSFAPGAYIKLESFGSKYAGNESDVNFLNRYWTVTTSGITNPIYDITATYANADIAGTEAEIAMGSWSGALPWVKNADVNSSANTVSRTNITATTLTFTGITSDPPTVSITASPAAICAGASSNLTAIPVGDTPFTYSWSPASGLSSTSIANPVATPGSTTSYTVVVTDGNGFTASDVISVTVNPTPTATAPANQSYCNSVATTAIPLTGSPSGVTFDISGGAAIGLSDQTGIATIPTFTPSTGSATITITPKANGCTGNAVTYTITVNPTPTATAPANQNYCNSVATAAIPLTGSPSGVTFDISGGA
ncbi:MAG: hypothetical protein JZU47_06590, partial [Prolixibacteraceae bacterium]|nr:hypothetical protein [Prolixibacteraceae bacterium]